MEGNLHTAIWYKKISRLLKSFTLFTNKKQTMLKCAHNQLNVICTVIGSSLLTTKWLNQSERTLMTCPMHKC